MQYFKSKDGAVFAYESDQDREKFGSNDLVTMSVAEVDAHLNPPPKPVTREEVTELRRLAYANLLTGSDPLYIEYQRAIATEAPDSEIADARAAWLQRAEEIAQQYPWPT